MNLQKLRLRNAGPFKDAEFSFHAPVSFLVGANESGKSTLKEWVTGLLFGFSGKKALRSSLIRWGEKEAVISADIRLEGDRLLRAERRVKESGATCLVETDGLARDLGDAPLPPLGDMDRDLYASVYSLRVEDLQFPDAAAWTALQSRLLSGEIAVFLRPVSEVSADWRDQALRIWRPDRRGNPTLTDHLKIKEELLTRLDEAESRQNLLRKLARDEEAMQAQLKEDAAVLTQTEAFLEKARVQQALMQDFNRYQRLMLQAGNLTPYAELPRDLEERWNQLERRLQEGEAALAEARKEKAADQAALDAYTDAERAVLNHRDEIRDLTGRRSQFQEDEANLRTLERDSAEARGQYRSLAGSVLSDPDAGLEILPRLSSARLQDAVQQYAAALDKKKQTESELRELELSSARSRKPLWGLLPALILLGGGVFLLLRPETLPQGSLIGGGLVAAGLILGALSVGAALPRHQGQVRLLQREAKSAARKAEDTEAALEFALQGLPVIESLREEPQELLRQVDALRHQLENLKNDEAQMLTLHNRRDRFILEGQELAEALLPDPPSDPLEASAALTDALDQAASLRGHAELTEKNAGAREERLSRLQEQYEKTISERDHFQSLLSSLPGATLADRMDELQRRRAAADRARSIADETFERTGERLADFGRKLAEEPWPWHDQAILEANDRVREIRERREEYRQRLGALTEERRSLLAQPTPADIQSEINAENETIERLTRDRDQTALAFGLLRLGEEAWRQEHQPELIRRAGDYLARITHGKYTRLFLPEGGKALLVYHEKSESYLDPIEKRLSKGTLEQIYLSLRLAMLDQLDPAGEPLPLLLDETLVNWDDRRADGLRDVLGQISSRRQVLFFTCHPETARRMGGDAAEILDLEAANET